MKFSKEQLNAKANVEKSENFLFLHFATAHMIFQLFRNSIFRVLILRFLIVFKNFVVRSFVRSFVSSFVRSVVSTLTCRFTFIYRFFGPLKGLPLNTLENYGMASWWPVKLRSNAVFQGLIPCVFCLKCMIVYHADAKSTLKSSIFAWKLLGQRGPGAYGMASWWPVKLR